MALGSTLPPIQWILGPLSPGGKVAGHEADHSPPASAKVKQMWIYKSITPYAFMVKHWANFTFTFLLSLRREENIFHLQERDSYCVTSCSSQIGLGSITRQGK
jgi:hypothetical protein